MNDKIDTKYNTEVNEINKRLADLNLVVHEMRDLINPTTMEPFKFVKLYDKKAFNAI